MYIADNIYEGRLTIGMNEQVFEEISAYLQKGNANKVKETVLAAAEAGIDPEEILTKGMLSGMDIIGEKFKKNEIFVPEVLIAARAMKIGTDALKPYLAKAGVQAKGTVVIGTVKGDLHDIGKNLVKMMLEGKGINVIDLGVDVPAEKFVDSALENNAQIICCSALLTTTMGEMRNVTALVKERGLNDKLKVMVGGAPVTQAFADEIGADVYTQDAASAAQEAIKILSA